TRQCSLPSTRSGCATELALTHVRACGRGAVVVAPFARPAFLRAPEHDPYTSGQCVQLRSLLSLLSVSSQPSPRAVAASTPRKMPGRHISASTPRWTGPSALDLRDSMPLPARTSTRRPP